MTTLRLRPLSVALAGALVAGLAVTATTTGVTDVQSASKVGAAVATHADVVCPPGTQPLGSGREAQIDQAAANSFYTGGSGASPAELSYGLYSDCEPVNKPESFEELAAREVQQSSIRSAPYESVQGEALLAAVDQRAALVGADVRGADGTMSKYGTGPLQFDDPRFGEVNGEGIVDATGRIDAFHYDAENRYLFAAIGTGGIWLSEDLGDTWRPISDSMPTQVVADVAFTSAGGPNGTVVVITGEHTFGGGSFLGLGAFYSRDLGETWTRAEGPLSGALGFAIAVDPTDPNVVYAATGKGLWRSGDAGVTYRDVVLPVGACAGDYTVSTCNYANFVTDVVVQTPAGSTDVAGGTVVAAVGYRAGMRENPDGSIHSEGNGIYKSETGQPGSFQRLSGLDDAIGGRERIGRMEFGPTIGADQDHNYLYVIVEDAVFFNGGSPILDGALLGDDLGKMVNATVLNGIYVSPDFGETWELIADHNELSNTCLLNQSVYCVPGLGVGPGVQAWYNMWVLPDPTRTDPLTGATTRLLFGIEEVWQNEITSAPVVNQATMFQVIGSYYGELGCLVGQCTGASVVTTTHPDQHAGIIIPTESGARLLVGHDGGVSMQDVDTAPALDAEFTQLTWQLDQENGLQTLLPYSAVWANDGVAWAGLQDNGHMRVAPEESGGAPTADGTLRQFETHGADGTFAAVDPENSDYAIESTQNAGMNVSVDGGETWADMGMPASNVRFVNPFVMDPLDANHITSGGSDIVESLAGSATRGADWVTVFDLGLSDTDPVIEVEVPGPHPPNQQTAMDTRGDTTYVGFCGTCDVLNSIYPFQNGLATNVNGDGDPVAGTTAGWHKTTAAGLPNRYITSVAIDPQDASQRTVYVTLGGFSRSWAPNGAGNNFSPNVGTGHVFKSVDAGESFIDISGNLPDSPALWVEPRGSQILVGTDVGPYISTNTSTSAQYAVLGGDQLPSVAITSMQLKPDDPDKVLLGTYGRGLWMYEFPEVDPNNPPTATIDIHRVAGADRIATAIDISTDTRTRADTIAIARSDLYADALAGSPLAFRDGAPLLLSRTSDLPAEVAAEIKRLGATHAIVLGGKNALSDAVISGLRAAGITSFERYAGEDRFETAALIAEELGGKNIYLTEGADPDPGRGWPDAMSIAPVAANQQRPILLTRTEDLPQATVDAIKDLGITGARIVGGPIAVSAAVEQDLAKLVKVGDRIAGENRYATSVLAAREGLKSGLRDQNLWLATGRNFPDALAAGPSVAASGGVLVLVDPNALANSPDTQAFINERICNVQVLRLLGGPVAITAGVENSVRGLFSDLTDCIDPVEAAGGVPTPPTPNPKGSDVPSAQPGTIAVGPFDFEADDNGFTADSLWTRSGPGADSDTAFRIDLYPDLADATLTSPSIDGAGGDGLIRFDASYNVEGGGFDELEVGIVEEGGDLVVLKTLGGISNGYPDFTTIDIAFTEPAGPYQLVFHFFADDICSGAANDGGLVLCGGAYEDVAVDNVTVLR